MCLLAVVSRVHPDSPLVVAANRDEWLERAADAMVVLREHNPRILGGRDRVAGGTWLAVGEHGVVAGLTNKPSTNKDPRKRSRGELPILLAQHASARAAVDAFVSSVRLADYNPCWILVGDRESLTYLDATGCDRAQPQALEPGLHVLENRALRAESPKVDWVCERLTGIDQVRGESLRPALHALLRSHAVPRGAAERPAPEPWRPPETEAACVHAGPYGTRSSSLIVVPHRPGPPSLWYSEGPPCTHDLKRADALWSAGS